MTANTDEHDKPMTKLEGALTRLQELIMAATMGEAWQPLGTPTPGHGATTTGIPAAATSKCNNDLKSPQSTTTLADIEQSRPRHQIKVKKRLPSNS
ncbi:unnamed protein product [Miscanthus lutarioriparius]|uniref:Uncharacterized protein n=1 Tax=Miscanthus lutarioriparius TaxID=422564 RepID=A0A811PPU9_9POAL|nr:unnamed protein product [Miscanthus lutarioriparius]